MASQRHHRLTLKQYVELTRNVRDVKLEFSDGTVWAMAGGSRRHNLLATRIAGRLLAALDGTPCTPMNSDQAVSTPDGLFTYPDVSVFCGPIDVVPGTEHATNPIVLVEVLSDSTRAYDEGEKLERYQRIPSLRDVLHVDQDAMCVVHYVRDAQGAWSSSQYTDADDVIALSGVGAKLRVGDVYAGAFDLPA